MIEPITTTPASAVEPIRPPASRAGSRRGSRRRRTWGTAVINRAAWQGWSDPARRSGLALRARLLLLGLPRPLRQLLLQHLAGRVAGELVDELDLARDLVAREVRLHVLLQLVLARLAVLGHHEGLEMLPELLVVDADHGHVGDLLVP